MTSRRERTRLIRDFILEHVDVHPSDIARITGDKFGISRQSVNRHLRMLVDEGMLTSSGTTRSREYALATVSELTVKLSVTPDLQEDIVWMENISSRLNDLPRNVLDICQYGFTEMLNNVIDHSESESVLVSLKRTATYVSMRVTDFGIGIFKKIQQELGLDDPRQALLELSKGKFTTDPAEHTGEGIFFTSWMFDDFSILSDEIFYNRENPGEGWLLEDPTDNLQGTHVHMKIRTESRQSMADVFDRYATSDDNLSFSRTHVPIRLASYEGEALVSRSQAKRLLARVDQFREVILDFAGVTTIGPSFADEIFRVFPARHPDVKLVPVNRTTEVDRMIGRVLANGRD